MFVYTRNNPRTEQLNQALGRGNRREGNSVSGLSSLFPFYVPEWKACALCVGVVWAGRSLWFELWLAITGNVPVVLPFT